MKKSSAQPKGVVYITTPIYYVNDEPHIGHVYTTLAADVLRRWHLLHGQEVFFLTGTDEHGAKVAESAQARGLDPKTFADQMSAKFQTIFRELAIEYSRFIRTTDQDHERQVIAFLKKLHQRGALYEGEYTGLYCTGCENFLTEKELINGLCPIHKKPPIQITEKNYFFKLSDYLEKVKRLIREGTIVIQPESRRQETLGLFKQDLKDFSVSREKVRWGIPFPLDPRQTVYVWVDALQNYITAIGYSDDRQTFNRLWPQAFHLLGKDILKFHTIYWPAMLLAAGEEPPQRLFIHGYFTINGQKMSKSLGNVIDPHSLLQRYGVDGTRYLLLTQFPFGEDGDVEANRFDEKFNADLANGIGNLVSRVLSMVTQFSGGEVPAIEKTPLPLLTQTEAAIKEYQSAMEAVALDRALKILLSVVEKSNGYIQKEKPWELAKHSDKQHLNIVLVDLLHVLQRIAFLAAPFLLNTSNSIVQALGLAKPVDVDASRQLPSGRSIHPIPALFPRLER